MKSEIINILIGVLVSIAFRSTATERARPVQSSVNWLSGEMVFQLNIHGPRGEQKVIRVCETKDEIKTITVRQLKDIISRELGIRADIRVVFKTDMLEDSSLLLSYGIRHMSNIHTLLQLPGGS